MLSNRWLGGALVVLAAGCQVRETPEQMQARMQQETEAAKQAFALAERNYERWTTEKKADSIGSLYTENGKQMPPNSPAVVGREAVIAAEAQNQQMYDGRLVITSEAAMVNGPLGIESGSYRFEGTPTKAAPPGTPPLKEDGKYLTHWHLVNGRWLIAELSFNSNAPMPMPTRPPARRR